MFLNSMRTSKFIVFAFFIVLAGFVAAQAQIDASSARGNPREEPLPKSILETLAKQRIAEEKKDYDELLKKSGEAVELTKELQNSFAKHKKLTAQDKSKLKSLEKLLKQVRSDLGGEGVDDEEMSEKSDSVSNMLSTLSKSTEQLFDEIKQTSRHTISAVAIKSSNAILSIVKFLRFGK